MGCARTLNVSAEVLADLSRLEDWVCQYCGTERKTLFSQLKGSPRVTARRMFAALARLRHGLSYLELALYMKRDHSGIVLALQKVKTSELMDWGHDYLSWLAGEMTRTNAPGPQDSEHVHNRAPIPDEDKPAVPGAAIGDA